ncbi:arsenical pump-driving ATPase [Exiguobacterium alkaliphilum]|uniref:arsenical pump-driving ATPase n=1 Tax=Exiguobacterium alkaliphilum TaxID=1428684 RepID=UPI001BAC226F|nr:arsenical pump-driving ATPase [Exiguobacterium alkaliphilum]QUE87329.1 arsenical pump-driving ATPase [Exiguobacterium alkaliphilum]
MDRFDFQTIEPTRYVFLTGKGGVGKTSTASSFALTLADRGMRVLLVSTDPASNLQDVFEMELDETPRTVPGTALSIANFDPEEAAKQYMERMVGPYRGVLPDVAIQSMEEQLSGACTVEIAAFDQFTELLTSEQARVAYDHVIFDTAPTGHTLRLLTLPSAWDEFLETNTTGASCLGPLAGLADKQNQYKQAVETLSNGAETTLLLVARPEVSTLVEAARAATELRAIGIERMQLVINGVVALEEGTDRYTKRFIERQQQALGELPEAVANLETFTLPYAYENLVGVPALRRWVNGKTVAMPDKTYDAGRYGSIDTLVDSIEKDGSSVVMTMGKGGVGKTTLASLIAVALSERGHAVHLTTTDPAAHVAFTIGEDVPSTFTVDAIDPKVEIEKYRMDVFREAGEMTDEQRLMLEEDLRSPCTEEIAVFRAFASQVAKAKDRFVVIDTAPTGHTLLLLDATESYHRELERSTGIVPEAVRDLLPKLRDPKQTHVVITTLPEATPVYEAERLVVDLERAEIHPFAWVVNQSFTPLDVTSTLLTAKVASETQWLDRVSKQPRPTLLSWQEQLPVGYPALSQLLKEEVK